MVDLSMKYQTVFRENYSQTRKGNLRCFPQCSEFHMEKTFCGQSVKILVENLHVGPSQAFIFGKIHETKKSKQYMIGDFCEISVLRGNETISVGNFASYEDPEGSITRFIIPSCRKWSVHKNFPRGMNFEFVAYLVVNNKIVSEVSSSSFGIQAVKCARRRSTRSKQEQQQQQARTLQINSNWKPELLLEQLNTPDKEEEHKVKREKFLMNDQSIFYSQYPSSQYLQQQSPTMQEINQQGIPMMFSSSIMSQQQLLPGHRFASHATSNSFLPIKESYLMHSPHQQQGIYPPPPLSFPTMVPENFFSNLYFPPVTSHDHNSGQNNTAYNDPTTLKVKQCILHENTLHFKI